MEKNLNILPTSLLADEIRKQCTLDDVLYLNSSNHLVFQSMSLDSNVKTMNYGRESSAKINNTNFNLDILQKELDDLQEKFDFIVGDLPIGVKEEILESPHRNLRIRTKKNWIVLMTSLFKLRENGYGLFLVESMFWSAKWKHFEDALSANGFFIDAIFNPPERILAPVTSTQPNIILVSKERKSNLYICELNEMSIDSIQTIVSNLREGVHTDQLETGMFVEKSDFKDFYNFKILNQIERLKSTYKEYKTYKLSDVSLMMNVGRRQFSFENIENSIYIPLYENDKVQTDVLQLRKHNNYIQVTLDSNLVRNQFLKIFFISDLGNLVRQSLTTRATTIPRINKKDLGLIFVPIPPMEEQNEIANIFESLTSLKESIEKFTKEIALNPKSTVSISGKVNDLLTGLDKLNNEDHIRALIRKGESKTCEFKQTLSLDIHKKIKNKDLEHAVLKTMVAFLNSQGGKLLVGVSDAGEITGLSKEIGKFYKNSNDKFLLHFRNLIKNQIGQKFYHYMDYNIFKIEDEEILLVDCKPSDIPCFLNEKEFFVRINPASEKLDGPKLLEYVNVRFQK